MSNSNTIVEALTANKNRRLRDIDPNQAGKVRRRVVDNEATTPKLTVAAFNSAT